MSSGVRIPLTLKSAGVSDAHQKFSDWWLFCLHAAAAGRRWFLHTESWAVGQEDETVWGLTFTLLFVSSYYDTSLQRCGLHYTSVNRVWTGAVRAGVQP